MSKGKYLKLEMEFPVTNECVKWFNGTCCGWGQKKTPYDAEGNIKGGPAPLWINPRPLLFKIYFIVGLFCSLLFVGSFIALQYYNNTLSAPFGLNTNTTSSNSTATIGVVVNSTVVNVTTSNNSTLDNNTFCVNTSYNYLKTWFIVIGSIILFLNSMYYLFLTLVDFASDQEWSRYMTLNFISWCALVGFVIADYLTFITNFKYFNEDPDKVFVLENTSSCQQLFQANLWCNLVVAIIISGLAVLELLTLFSIAKNFFIKKHVVHSARNIEEAIIVL